MAFKRRRTFKKRHFKRRPTLKRKVARIARVLRHNAPELKYDTYGVTGQQFNNSPTTSYTTDITSQVSQGLGDSGARIGDRIFLKRLMFRMKITSTVADIVHFRLVVARFKQNISGSVSLASLGNAIMDQTYSGTENAVNAPYNYDNKKTNKILYDKVWSLAPTAGDPTVSGVAFPTGKHMNINIPCNFPVEYFNGGTTAATNQVVMFFISNRAAASTFWTDLTLRMYYTDA